MFDQGWNDGRNIYRIYKEDSDGTWIFNGYL